MAALILSLSLSLSFHPIPISSSVAEDVCQEQRIYDYAKVGMPFSKVAHYVELNYYPDKELLVSVLTD